VRPSGSLLQNDLIFRFDLFPDGLSFARHDGSDAFIYKGSVQLGAVISKPQNAQEKISKIRKKIRCF
jgi:hypothetical protein